MRFLLLQFFQFDLAFLLINLSHLASLLKRKVCRNENTTPNIKVLIITLFRAVLPSKACFKGSNKNEIKEAKAFSSFMMSNILKMLHPFIPFFTESVWSKNNYKKIFKTNLITSEWPKYKNNTKFNKNHNDINKIKEFISNIRSTKAELKITPKLFCDLSFYEKSGKLKELIEDNFNLTPRGIREMLKLNNSIYEITSAYGHFGRKATNKGEFTWEKTDKIDLFKL